MVTAKERLNAGRAISDALKVGFSETESQRLAFLQWRVERGMTDAGTGNRLLEPPGGDHSGASSPVEIPGD